MILEIIAEDRKKKSLESPSVAIKCKQLLLLERQGITICKCKVQTIRLNLCGPLLYPAITLPFLYLNSTFCLLVFFASSGNTVDRKPFAELGCSTTEQICFPLHTNPPTGRLNASLCLGCMLLVFVVRKPNMTYNPHNKAKDRVYNAFSASFSFQHKTQTTVTLFIRSDSARRVYLACNACNQLSMFQTCGPFLDLRVPLVPVACRGPKLFCGCVFASCIGTTCSMCTYKLLALIPRNALAI